MPPPPPSDRWRRVAAGAALIAGVALASWLLWPRPPSAPPADAAADAPAPAAPAPAASPRPAAVPAPAAAPGDPAVEGRDLADVLRLAPGEPVPSMGQVIARLRAEGIRTGLAAFNPPGTSPPLVGLAVPEDFPLPEGYVRHHQVTDDGQPIEPILMFSPDYAFYDAQGRPLPIPPDRVVPPQWAPPGLPLRWITIPPPRAATPAPGR